MPSNPLTYFSHGIRTNVVVLTTAPLAVDTSAYSFYSGSTMPAYFGGPVMMNLETTTLPVNNEDMTFSLTANTTLTIRVKGTDGTVRSAAITLA